jgi:3-methyladenine DNA glycosylase AlkC
MKAEIRSILTDVKAAARIGHVDSIEIALEGLFRLPNVAANQMMNEVFIEQAILPIGEILADSRLNGGLLRSMTNNQHAALRAIAAVALALRYLKGDDKAAQDLRRIGSDARADVRAALSAAFRAAENSARVISLTRAWLGSKSPRQKQIAVAVLPNLVDTYPDEVWALLRPLHSEGDTDVRTALAETLNTLAQAGHAAQVLAILEDWVKQPDVKGWVVTRTLSRAWAAEHAAEALAILRQLTITKGPKRKVRNAIQALAQHGADELVQAELTAWANDPEPYVRALIHDMNTSNTVLS